MKVQEDCKSYEKELVTILNKSIFRIVT